MGMFLILNSLNTSVLDTVFLKFALGYSHHKVDLVQANVISNEPSQWDAENCLTDTVNQT